MDHEVVPGQMAFFPWPNFHGQFFFKLQILKPLGMSVGVNRAWTKRSDHAPRSRFIDFFNTCPKREVLVFFFVMLYLLHPFPLNSSHVKLYI